MSNLGLQRFRQATAAQAVRRCRLAVGDERCGTQGKATFVARGCDSASYPAEPLVSFRTHRQLSGWNLPPRLLLAFAAHCEGDTFGPYHRTSPPRRLLAVFGASRPDLRDFPDFSDAACERHWSCREGAPMGAVKQHDGLPKKARSQMEEYDISACVLLLPLLTALPDSKRETPTLDVTQHSTKRICEACHTRMPSAFSRDSLSGVDRALDNLFAVMGDANQDMMVDLDENHGVKFVHAHHEGSAVSMADGYAQFSGDPGLASVTQGPGYTNATTSLVAARAHRTPVLLLAGHASLRDPYNPQGLMNQHELAKLTTEAPVKLDPARNVDYCLGEAFRQLRGKKGPFVLNMPLDIQPSESPDAG
jgi:Thiamine pyrophosphate enzyme, N-terminal TPP binding domain